MRTIKHSTGRQFLSLSGIDAAMLVASGRWMYCKRWEAKWDGPERPARDDTRECVYVAAIGIAAVATLAILMWAVPAKARECLNENQARKFYGVSALHYRQVLANQCWYPRSLGVLPRSEFQPGAERRPRLAPTRTNASEGGVAKSVGATPTAGNPFDAFDDFATFQQRWRLR